MVSIPSSIERWRPIIGYVGLYEVSSFGRVRSVSRTLKQPYKGRVLVRRVRERVLKQADDGHGYLFVGLYKGSRGSERGRYVHQLVLEAFVGPCPEGMEVCHFPDRNPTNNKLENLRWDTKKANSNDKKLHGNNNDGERHGIAKMTNEKVLEARRRYAETNVTMRQLADEYGIHVMTVHSIIRRKTWDHI